MPVASDCDSEVISAYLEELEKLTATIKRVRRATVLYELADCYQAQREPRWDEAIACYREAAEVEGRFGVFRIPEFFGRSDERSDFWRNKPLRRVNDRNTDRLAPPIRQNGNKLSLFHLFRAKKTRQ